MASLSRRLVRQIVAAGEQPPERLIARTRLHVADATAIALAASARSPMTAQLLGSTIGAHGPCRVIGRGERLPPGLAAYVNAALVHTLDFDDIHDLARLHPTAVTLPAALAAADLVDATGETVLRGVLLGNELMCRLGCAWAPGGSGPGSEWFLTQLFGYFGAALAAGIVLGLPEDGLVSALGLAYMQAAGGKQAGFGTGSDARSIYPAFAAMGGTHAALQARAGVTGPEEALDGAAGLFRIYLGGDAGPEQVAQLLDAGAFAWEATEIKPWPSCRLSHPYLAAALAVRAQLGGAPPLHVVIGVNASAARLCRPLAARRRPATLQDAKYSIPFMTSFMLVHGRVDLDNLTAAALADPAVLALAGRIEIRDGLPDRPGHPPAEITAAFAGGTATGRMAGALALDAAQVAAKFRACLRHAGIASLADPLWSALTDPCGTGPLAAFTAVLPAAP